MPRRDSFLPANEKALIAAINRKLKHQGVQLRTSRTVRMECTVGKHYLTATENGFIFEHDVDPVRIGTDLGLVSGNRAAW